MEDIKFSYEGVNSHVGGSEISITRALPAQLKVAYEGFDSGGTGRNGEGLNSALS